MLNARMKLFCQEYLIDFNASRAAKEAGYSADANGQIGHTLLKKTEIQDYIQMQANRRLELVGIEINDILRKLYTIANFDLEEVYDDNGNLLNIKQMPKEARKCIVGIEVDQLWEGSGRDKYQVGVTTKVKFWDKTKALELLGKYKKMFTDRVELSGSLDTKVNVTIDKAEVREILHEILSEC